MMNAAATSIIEELRRVGVTVFCVCAGARNSALIAALAESVTGDERVYHFVDERCAGFFAVGCALRKRCPVAVLTTSGTAVAELLPAVVEAHYQALPLIVVSADRPRRFYGSGAPQVIAQPGIFGGYVSASVEIDVAQSGSGCLSAWEGVGAVHLNVAFEEPGSAVHGGAEGIERKKILVSALQPKKALQVDDFFADTDGIVVVLGELAPFSREAVRSVLIALGAPVWAEAASGLREDKALEALLLCGGEKVFAKNAFRKVLRIGGVPSCRFWRDLDAMVDIPVLSVSATGYSGLARPSAVVRQFDVLPEMLPEVVSKKREAPWSATDTAARQYLDTLLARWPGSEPALVRGLSERIDAEAAVFLGNSMPIREWNLAATREDRGLRCFANRGANGIDGLLSTFFGLAESHETAWAIVGDLSALYDLGALWIDRQLPPGKRVIVVMNNGGGKIFARLPALAALPEAARELIENPHQTGFAAWAQMWDWSYQKVTGGELADIEVSDKTVLELVPDANETEQFWKEWEGFQG